MEEVLIAKDNSQLRQSILGGLPGFLRSPKLIFVVLGAVIVVEVILGLKFLMTPLPKVATLEQVSGGKIVLISDKTSYAVGETIPVTIRVSTGGFTTDGTDLILNFDPQLLEVESNSVFKKGSVYAEYPVVSVDSRAGSVRISGITSVGSSGFNGTGEFATLTFKAKATGKASLIAEFKPGLTTDSNIIQTKVADDVLSAVYNLDLAVGEGTGTQVDLSSGSCENFSQACWDENGRLGTQKCSQGRTKNDHCSWDPYLTTDCGSCEISQ